MNGTLFLPSVESLSILRDKLRLQEEMMSGKTLYEIAGFSSDTMEKFYAAAYQIYANGAYLDSADAFFFLTHLNPLDPRFWLGLGMSEQHCCRYQAAIYAYSMAIYVESSDPLPYYLMACCYELLHQPSEALKSVELAIHFAQEGQLLQEALALKARL